MISLALGIALSLLVGLALGTIGAGGSILTVPILHYVMGRDAIESTALSLFIVGATAAAAAVHYGRHGLIAYREGLLFAIPSFVSVYLVRNLLIPHLPAEVGWGAVSVPRDMLVLVVFAVIMVLAAAAMIRPSRRAKTDGADPSSSGVDLPEQTSLKGKSSAVRFTATVVEGAIVGGVTGFVGAGGGFLIVPALVLLVGLDMKKAVGTSLMIIAIKSLIGFGGDLAAGRDIPWGLLSGVTVAALVGMALGLRVAHRVPGDRLKPAFGYFVLVMACVILAKELIWR
jgi:uncharacterized membrane protein YfcA